MNNWTGVAVFSIGVAAGSVGTWLWLHKSMNDQIEEAWKSAREFYTKEKEERAKQEEPLKNDIPEKKPEEVKPFNTGDEPVIIPPDDFGEIEEYMRISMTYYSDGVLTDDTNDIVEDPIDCLGKGAIEQMGLYEPGAIHVRNDRRKAYFEVLEDLRKYSDVVKTVPKRIHLE